MCHRTLLFALIALGMPAVLAGCEGQPCADDDPTCLSPAPPVAGFRLTHGALVVAGGDAVDDAHDLRATVSMGHVDSRAGDLRLVGTLRD